MYLRRVYPQELAPLSPPSTASPCLVQRFQHGEEHSVSWSDHPTSILKDVSIARQTKVNTPLCHFPPPRETDELDFSKIVGDRHCRASSSWPNLVEPVLQLLLLAPLSCSQSESTSSLTCLLLVRNRGLTKTGFRHPCIWILQGGSLCGLRPHPHTPSPGAFAWQALLFALGIALCWLLC